jgi:hypothetical protein
MNSYEFVSILVAILGTLAWIAGFLTHTKIGEER